MLLLRCTSPQPLGLLCATENLFFTVLLSTHTDRQIAEQIGRLDSCWNNFRPFSPVSLYKEPSGSSGSAHSQLPQTAGRALSSPSDLTWISCAWKLLVSRLSAFHLVVKQTGNFIVNLGETNLLIQHREGPVVSVTKLLSHPWRLISASQHCSKQIGIWHSLCPADELGLNSRLSIKDSL